MKLRRTFNDLIQFVFAAVNRIFSPTDDEYPATGVQPFEGDLRSRRSYDR